MNTHTGIRGRGRDRVVAARRHEHSGRGEGRGSTSGARGRSSCKGRGTGRGVGASANDQLTDSQREILVNGWKQHENVLTNNPFQGATPGPSSEGLPHIYCSHPS